MDQQIRTRINIFPLIVNFHNVNEIINKAWESIQDYIEKSNKLLFGCGDKMKEVYEIRVYFIIRF